MSGAKENFAEYWKWILLVLLLLLLGVAGRYTLSHAKHASNGIPTSTTDLVSDGQGKFTILAFQPNEWSTQPNVQRLRRHHVSSFVELSTGPVVPQTIAFLVRTYNPSEENAKIVAQWFSELRSSPNVHTHVSIDQTIPGHEENVTFLIERLLDAGFHVSNIHRYTVDDMRREYPALTGKEVLGSLAWGYHIQAIDLWMQTLPQKDQTYEHLWTLEDDVGYTGDISRLLHKYSRNSADLIGGIDHNIASAQWWPTAPTELYMKWLHNARADRLHFREHCTRMSAKLLGRLHALSAGGALDWSESMPVTVCHVEQMQCSTLDADDVGKPYSCCDRPIKKTEEWETVKSKNASAGHPRLYHPLKF